MPELERIADTTVEDVAGELRDSHHLAARYVPDMGGDCIVIQHREAYLVAAPADNIDETWAGWWLLCSYVSEDAHQGGAWPIGEAWVDITGDDDPFPTEIAHAIAQAVAA